VVEILALSTVYLRLSPPLLFTLRTFLTCTLNVIFNMPTEAGRPKHCLIYVAYKHAERKTETQKQSNNKVEVHVQVHHFIATNMSKTAVNSFLSLYLKD